MAKMSAAQDKNHHEAMELVNLERPLTMTEKEFVLANYKPHAEHNVRKLQAYFTPLELGIAATIEMPSPAEKTSGKIKILDLCAGIGMLSFSYLHYSGLAVNADNTELVCVEMTEELARVGKRILPEATWIVADMFNLGNKNSDNYYNVEIDDDFDCFISNPPFSRFGPSHLVGRKGCYITAQIGLQFCEYGVMIVPKCNCPFEYSGRDNHKIVDNREYTTFSDKAKIEFKPSCVDTASVLDDNDEPVKWDDVNVDTEIVIVDPIGVV